MDAYFFFAMKLAIYIYNETDYEERGRERTRRRRKGRGLVGPLAHRRKLEAWGKFRVGPTFFNLFLLLLWRWSNDDDDVMLLSSWWRRAKSTFWSFGLTISRVKYYIGFDLVLSFYLFIRIIKINSPSVLPILYNYFIFSKHLFIYFKF